MNNRSVTRWRTDGYGRATGSPEYHSFVEMLDGIDVDEGLKRAGYARLYTYVGTETGLHTRLYEHQKTQDLFLEMWNCDQVIAEVHVEFAHRSAFLLTEYLQILQRMKTLDEAGDLDRIHKAFVTFIRHGHGTHVIDAWGMSTRDENYLDRFGDKQRDKADPVG